MLHLLRTLTLTSMLALALAAPAASQASAPERFYVSLGDSYATGYQVIDPSGGRNTRNGFAYQVPALARERGHRLRLVNFGCGGETSTSLLERVAVCRGPGPGGRSYAGSSQIAAAERFLRARRGRVGLITISIGGNDVTACAAAPEPIPCVAGAVKRVEANTREISRRLRRAAGPRVRIVGIAYPDVILGRWIGTDANQDLARLSVVAFKDLINPALERAYASVGGRLVDVTRASGAYGPLERLVEFTPGQLLPRPVARVCELTYYCEFRDIHARTSGYALIARLIVRTLPILAGETAR